MELRIHRAKKSFVQLQCCKENLYLDLVSLIVIILDFLNSVGEESATNELWPKIFYPNSKYSNFFVMRHQLFRPKMKSF